MVPIASLVRYHIMKSFIFSTVAVRRREALIFSRVGVGRRVLRAPFTAVL